MNDSPAASPDDPPEISSANAVNSTLSGWGNYPKVNCTVHFQRQVDVLRNLLVEGNVMRFPEGWDAVMAIPLSIRTECLFRHLAIACWLLMNKPVA